MILIYLIGIKTGRSYKRKRNFYNNPEYRNVFFPTKFVFFSLFDTFVINITIDNLLSLPPPAFMCTYKKTNLLHFPRWKFPNTPLKLLLCTVYSGYRRTDGFYIFVFFSPPVIIYCHRYPFRTKREAVYYIIIFSIIHNQCTNVRYTDISQVSVY